MNQLNHLVWLPEAVRDLARLRAFLEPLASNAAQRAATRIRQAVASLMEQPEIGRAVEGDPAGLRELVIRFGVGAYIVDPGRVVIARVWHSREERGQDD